MIKSFESCVPTKIVYQEGAVKERLVEQLSEFDHSALAIIADKGVVNAGLLQIVVGAEGFLVNA